MSSTCRGYKRHVSDYYVTPQWQIELFLEEFLRHEPNALDGLILDPCAGGCEIYEPSYPTVLKKYTDSKIATIDIREDSKAEIIADYLNYSLSEKPKIIITNPPFAIAEKVIRKALNEVQENGFVVMLLRLNYYGSEKRQILWSGKEAIGLPKYTFVHPKRISFTGDGKTDSIEYAHFVWQKGYDENHSNLRVLKYTK